MNLAGFAVIISLTATAVAHGGVYWYNISGTEYYGNPWGFTWNGNPVANPDPSLSFDSIQRRWDYNPIENLTSPNLTCGYDGAATHPSRHAPIAAGTNITAYWTNPQMINYTHSVIDQGYWWPHDNGPLMTYLAECPGTCEGFDGSGKVWFKINQVGLQPQAQDMRGPWWQDVYVKYNWPGQDSPGYTVTIPKNLKPGHYLIRTEVMMTASEPAQFYPECAQLRITGNGKRKPCDNYLVSFPGAYSPDDPGIAMCRWFFTEGGTLNGAILPEWNGTDFPYPGPAVWTGEEDYVEGF